MPRDDPLDEPRNRSRDDWTRAPRPGIRPVRTALAGLVGLGAALVALGCGGVEQATGVEPLATGGSTAAGGGPDGDAGPQAAPPPSAPGSMTTAPTTGSGTAAIRHEIEALLSAFDRAVSDLSADPEAAGEDDHPLSAAWLAVVAPDSTLDREVRSRILTQGVDDNMRYVPDHSGTIYRHSPLDIEASTVGGSTVGGSTVEGETVSWEYCGYSPGIGIDRDTGEALDNRRSTIRGRASAARRPGGDLVMVRFTDTSVEVLAPGVPDPCPELSAEARRRENSDGAGGPR